MTHKSEFRLARDYRGKAREGERYTPTPVVVSHFDPRTGEPSPVKCPPLRAKKAEPESRAQREARYRAAEEQGREISEAMERRRSCEAKRKSRAKTRKRETPTGVAGCGMYRAVAVVVDGVRYRTTRAAADAIGVSQSALSAALREGRAEYRGHAIERAANG
mgnify:CR=1 FL=1